MRIGLIENWDEIQKEFDLWEKTIHRTFRICMVLLVLGLVSSFLLLFLSKGGLFSILPVAGFGVLGLLYNYIIGDRKIQAHKDRIDELSK